MSAPFRGSSAALSLALLTAHIVYVQFSFVTVPNSIPLWLGLGLLLAPRQPRAFEPPPHLLPLAAGGAGALLLRTFAGSSDASILAVMAIALLLIGALSLFAWPRPLIVAFWGFGLLGAFLTDPALSALWDVGFLLGLLAVLGGRSLRVPSLRAAYVVALAVAFAWWWADIRADIHLKHALNETDPVVQWVDLTTAALLRPWDHRLAGAAGDAALRSLPLTPDDEARALAAALLQRAALLNPYDAGHAQRLRSLD